MKTHAQNRGRVNRQRARRRTRASDKSDAQQLLRVDGEQARFLEKYRAYLEEYYKNQRNL